MATLADSTFSDAMICPITMEVMTDPVIDNEGVSYERQAITDWLSKNDTSPVTRQPLTVEQLKPNHALRNIIENHKQAKATESNEEAHASSSAAAAASSESDVKLQVRMTPPDASGEALALVKVVTPEGRNRTSCDICAVIDVSGSMCSAAKIKTGAGEEESHGLSMLDVVKHGVKTIINALNEKDRLSIVVYSSEARLVMPLTRMTDANKRNAEVAVANLTTGGQTNMWGGLSLGMDILRARGQNTERKPGFIFILTDGLPNIVPPRGHVPMLQRYKDKYPNFTCTINTFGFGYNLDSKLLHEIAAEGDGMYSFIPDSSFVGTCFVHALANMLVTTGKGSVVSIEATEGAKVESVLGANSANKAILTSWGASIRVGCFQYDQPREFLVRVSHFREGVSEICATIEYDSMTSNEHKKATTEGDVETVSKSSMAEPLARVHLIDCIKNAMAAAHKKDFEKAMAIVAESVAMINSNREGQSAEIDNILKDIEGQVTEAISRQDWFERWGRHYLLGLMNAHFLQLCSNFKDPGVQNYASGKLFTAQRDLADDLFCNLPPPTPSRQVKSSRNVSGGAKFSMASYSRASGPCFAGSSMVKTISKVGVPVLKRVDQIERGDWVESDGQHGRGRVECIVETRCHGGMESLVELPNGLLVTPWHPIKDYRKDEKQWCFPNDIANPKLRPCEAIYSFLLEKGHGSWMTINDTACITLGHGLDEPVAKHAYFGNRDLILRDLEGMDGWNRGHVTLQPGSCVRGKDGLVSALRQQRPNMGL